MADVAKIHAPKNIKMVRKLCKVSAQIYEQNELSAEGILFEKAIIAELFATNLGSA